MLLPPALRRFLLAAVVLGATASPSWAVSIQQFGLIFPTEYRMGNHLETGGGFQTQSFVIANLGMTSLSLSDFVFTSSLVSSTTPLEPVVDSHIGPGGIVIAPGQAFGYLNADFNQALTLPYVQSFFPTISTLTIHPDYGLFAGLSFDSGAFFQDTQTIVNYHLRIGGANAHWTASYELGVSDLQPGLTEGTLGYGVSNAARVPEPSTLILVVLGLIVLCLPRCRNPFRSC